LPVGRVLAILDAVQADEKAEWESRIVSMWALGRAVDAAITSSQDMPQTKADTKKKPSDAKLAQAKKHRIEHDKLWYDALRSPKHYGAWLGMPHVLGEPERPPEKTSEDRAKEGMEAAKRALRNLLSPRR